MKRRRFIAVGCVLIATASAFAVAAPDFPGLEITPEVVVIGTSSAGGSGAAQLVNEGEDDVTVGMITADPSCSTGISVAAGTLPFTLAAGSGTRTLMYTCAPSATGGMRRCIWQAATAAGVPLIDFEAVCETRGMPSLSPSTTMIDLGDVPVGGAASAMASVTNLSPTTITTLFFQTTDLDGNFKLGAPCNPDARECNAAVGNLGNGMAQPFSVLCTPQAAGLHTAQLHIASNTSQYLSQVIALRCNGIAPATPAISVSPSPADVGNVEVVGTASATKTVTIANIGGGTLRIQSIAINDSVPGAAADWSYTTTGACMGAIPPACDLTTNQQLAVQLELDPTAIGARDANLLINYHDTIDRSISVPLLGIGRGATLSLVGGQPQLDFGVVPLNMTSTVTFELANAGNRDTTAMLAIDAPVGPFTLSPMATATVTAGMPTTITATCRPTATGMFTTTFRVSSADAASMPIAITARCEGTSAALYGSPTTLQLGEVRTGTGPVRRPLMVLAVGPAASLASVALESPDSNLAVTPLSSTSTPAAFELVVTPTSDGDLSQNAIIVTPTSGAPLRIPISGKVVTASYQVLDTVSLGTFCINQPTTTSTLRLTSTGTATIELAEPALAQPGSPFDLRFSSPSRYAARLAPGGVALVGVTPRRQFVPGAQADELVWMTDVAAMPTARTALTAEFIDEGAAAAPSALGFGKVPIHVATMSSQSVTLQNCENTAIQLDTPQISAPFSIDSPSFPTTLMPNEAATFSVGFYPTRLGRFEQRLVIRFNAPPLEPLEILLDGEGITGDGGPGDGDLDGERTSFYACSGCASNDPSGVLAIVLAACCALLPRRRRTAR
ncbi:MAG: choice-of-anchor D domain-containing protein [Deltaproteobacteria bacterium]|nr:choice-of-anchor D domain-containing protein [Deltaproteobacteria bacterium]MDQ3296528.1 choice-of-anchor D domain-containing protein [Myxococcota bacterium]